MANAYPLSNPSFSIPFNYAFNFAANAPVYTGGVLQPVVPATAVQNVATTTTGQLITANLAVQSAYGSGSTNRSTSLFTAYNQVWPVTANTMSNNDRVRGAVAITEVIPNGYTWGLMNATTQNATSINGITGVASATGTGNVASLAGLQGLAAITTGTSGANLTVQYATGIMSTVSYTLTNGGANQTAYARLYGGFISGAATITNAVGLHLWNGWAGTGTITNRYAILIEDPLAVIKSNANITVTASTTSGFNSTGVFTATALNAITGVSGQIAAVSNGSGKNGGQLAYWDTTNTRWSWVDTNLAVS